MKTNKLIATALAASLVFATTTPSMAGYYICHPKVIPGKTMGGGGGQWAVWGVIGCAGGIVVAALAANARDHRELTAQEAWGCGLPFFVSLPAAASSQAPVRAKG